MIATAIRPARILAPCQAAAGSSSAADHIVKKACAGIA
ncbi:hypothetical protein KVC_1636 [Ketogulonicigenium vulgare]|uniref:Uncharacterized protein n=1 Tax=Ketogulonicigenium vulgare (strain WSH-001) TaxID=759362 RepID=F9Y6H9_KETVW|nr:hypothetical protein KVU_1086 [Ketogulonicigenium vulgare WSH-001]AOZ54650.1 hypothetical protein KVC_1636 [Ketogulonicigenium vulgare]